VNYFFLVGAGRSGTSATASLFNGTRLSPISSYKPRESNPLGFYEDEQVNAINEKILSRYLPNSEPSESCGYGADKPGPGQLWLARIPLSTSIETTDLEREQIQNYSVQAKFCIKDPRLSYTLECWRSCMTEDQQQETGYICIFRNPASVIKSVAKEVLTTDYLKHFAISRSQILSCWLLQYQWILQKHVLKGNWYFLDYEQLLDGSAFDPLEAFCQMRLARTVINPKLNRSQLTIDLGGQIVEIYKQLQELSQESISKYYDTK